MYNNFPQGAQTQDHTIWSTNPNLKTLLVVLIFVFLFCGLALGILQVIGQNSRDELYSQVVLSLPQHHPAPHIKTEKASSTTLDIAGWKTYKNSEYGFEFPYPSAWVYEIVGGEGYGGHTNFYSSGEISSPKDMVAPNFEVSIDQNIQNQDIVSFYDNNGNFGTQQRVVMTTKNGYDAEKFFAIAGAGDSNIIAVKKGNIFIEFQDFNPESVWDTLIDRISDNLK